MDKKALIEERIKLHEENRALLEKAEKEKRTLTAEELAQCDARDARMNELRKTLERIEQTDAEERALGESRGRKTGTTTTGNGQSDVDRDLAFRGWCLGKHATPEMREAAQRVGVRIDQSHIDMAAVRVRTDKGVELRYFPVRTNSACDIEVRSFEEARALSVGTATAGGNTVPNEVMQAYYDVLKWYGGVREEAQIIQTQTGATLPWPKIDDTGNTGRILAEGTAATTTTDPTTAVVNLGAYKFSSDAVLVSWEVLQDSFIPLDSYLGTALGRRIGRIQNTKFTVGTGTGEPKGVQDGAGAGKTAAATNAFTADEVIDLIHSVDKAYRALPDTKFMMHDTVASYVRKLKDGNGRYLWEMSLQVGQPDRLFGYPATINNDMDSAFTTAKKLILFGNFKLGFIVRDAGAVRFVRSDEKYILEHQVMFEASQRSDSNIIDTTAIKRLNLA